MKALDFLGIYLSSGVYVAFSLLKFHFIFKEM